MALDKSKVIKGPVDVSIGGTPVGHQEADATVKFIPKSTEYVSKDSGNIPIAEVLHTHRAEVEFQALEVDATTLAYLFPAYTINGNVISFDVDDADQELTAVGTVIVKSRLDGYGVTIYDAYFKPQDITPVGEADGGKFVLKLKLTHLWKDSGNMWTFGAIDDTTAPTVDSISPVDGATGVATSTTVVITFDEAMNPGQLTTANFLLIKTTDGTAVSVTLTYNNAHTQVTLTPVSALTAATKYLVLIKRAVCDEAGNQLATDYIADFTTA